MRRVAIPLISLAFFACGGSDSSGPTEARMNFSPAGLKSATGSTTITIPTGGKVHFFNTDSAPHQAQSSTCAELNTGVLAPNSDQLVGPLNNPASCSVVDGTNPSNGTFQAFVTVAAAPAGGGGGGGGGSGY